MVAGTGNSSVQILQSGSDARHDLDPGRPTQLLCQAIIAEVRQKTSRMRLIQQSSRFLALTIPQQWQDVGMGESGQQPDLRCSEALKPSVLSWILAFQLSDQHRHDPMVAGHVLSAKDTYVQPLRLRPRKRAMLHVFQGYVPKLPAAQRGQPLASLRAHARIVDGPLQLDALLLFQWHRTCLVDDSEGLVLDSLPFGKKRWSQTWGVAPPSWRGRHAQPIQ
mmetsp:Transcript_22070/g.41592  ORF Transcript_22070/g.41592 Transcript_22070/m.41592 type:complete len:221 (+) Transcript_22070:720-1382(+)